MRVADNNNRKTLHGFIREHVADDAEAIYTDEWAAYRGIADANTRHETVNHRAEEWVRGPVHTNSIEGTWSLFNRALVGSYHQVQRKHFGHRGGRNSGWPKARATRTWQPWLEPLVRHRQ